MFSVFRNFAPFDEYLYDRVGGWTSSTSGYSVEIGRGFNTLSLFCLAAAAAGLARGRLSWASVKERLAAWVLVLGSGACYARASDAARGAALPARASAPVPPVSLAPARVFDGGSRSCALCLSLDLLETGSLRAGFLRALRAAPVLAVLFQVFFGVGRPPPDRILSAKEIEASLTTERLAATSVFSGAFRPRGISLPPPRPFLEAADCVVVSASPAWALSGVADVPELRLTVDAAPGGTLVINQFVNPFLAVSAGGEGRVERTAWGTYLVRPAPGRSEIVVRRRGLLAALRVRLSGG